MAEKRPRLCISIIASVAAPFMLTVGLLRQNGGVRRLLSASERALGNDDPSPLESRKCDQGEPTLGLPLVTTTDTRPGCRGLARGSTDESRPRGRHQDSQVTGVIVDAFMCPGCRCAGGTSRRATGLQVKGVARTTTTGRSHRTAGEGAGRDARRCDQGCQVGGIQPHCGRLRHLHSIADRRCEQAKLATGGTGTGVTGRAAESWKPGVRGNVNADASRVAGSPAQDRIATKFEGRGSGTVPRQYAQSQRPSLVVIMCASRQWARGPCRGQDQDWDLCGVI